MCKLVCLYMVGLVNINIICSELSFLYISVDFFVRYFEIRFCVKICSK